MTNTLGETKEYKNKTTKEKIEHQEKNLKKIETEIEQFEKEIKVKNERAEKKKRKEKHWEMAKWLVEYIEENREIWRENEKEKEIKRREDEEDQELWDTLTRAEKIEELKKEEKSEKMRQNSLTAEERKEERLQKVRKEKENWRKWREEQPQEEKEVEKDLNRDMEPLIEEKEEEEEIEKPDLGEEKKEICEDCVMVPCVCLLLKLELRLKMLKNEESGEMGDKEKEIGEIEERDMGEVKNMKTTPPQVSLPPQKTQLHKPQLLKLLPPSQTSLTSPQTQNKPSHRNPDNSSLNQESIAQGFPPVPVAPSVEHLHAGCLGEVTLRGGTVTSPTPFPRPPP